MLCYENTHGKFNHFVPHDISMRRRGAEGSTVYVTCGTRRERRLHWWVKKEVLSGESSGLWRYLAYLITKHVSDIWCYGLYVRTHGGASGKESTCQCRKHKRCRFDPWLEIGNPLQHSCLDNPTDRRAWWAIVRGVSKSLKWLKWVSTLTYIYIYIHTHIHVLVIIFLYIYVHIHVHMHIHIFILKGSIASETCHMYKI